MSPRWFWKQKERQSGLPTNPVFIVGSVRSGSTHLSKLLNVHHNLVVGNEDRLPLLFQEFLAMIETPPGQVRVKKVATDPTLQRELGFEGVLGFYGNKWLRGSFTQSFTRLFHELTLEFYQGPRASAIQAETGLKKKGAKRWGDKLGTFWPHELVEAHYPQAQFLHIFRDGRDVVVSMRRFSEKQPLAPWGHFSFEESCQTWVTTTSLMREKGNQLAASRYCEVRYEDLVEREESVLYELFAFLGEETGREVEKQYRRYRKKGYGNRLFEQHGTSRSPRASIGRWRNALSEEEKATAHRIMAPLLGELGYGLDEGVG